MSITRNRELSQFGSFIYIDDNSQSIGISTETTPFVGIGTTNPSVKFEVVGDTNISGNVSIGESISISKFANIGESVNIGGSLNVGSSIEASSYTINGNPLVDVTIQPWNFADNNTDIYRLSGNVAIGTSSFTQRLTVNGNISAGRIISTVSSGTAPFAVTSNTLVTNLNADFLRGKVPPSGNIVGTTDVQTLSNKTFSSPTILSSLSFLGSISGNTTLQADSIASGSIILPSSSTTLVGRNTEDTLTNKTISAISNTITDITTSNLSGSASILNSQLANSTISGISLGNNLETLTFGSYLTSSGSYNGSTGRSVSVAATTINTPNTIVARDGSGDFIAGSINCSNLTATFDITATDINCDTITAADINSTSDLNLKTNVNTIGNPLDIINSLRGVSFDWKSNGNKSYGVIAQELEQILPELVTTKENKSVNYNGLVGVLIQAVKELSAEVEELKKKVI